MGRQMITDGQVSFKGGLNTQAADLNISGDEARTLENCHIDQFGSAEKRQGIRRSSAAAIAGATSILGGFGWNRAAASNLQVVVSNTDLWYSAFSGYPATWTLVAGALSTTVRPFFRVFRDNASNEVLFIADGGPLNFFSGVALTENIASTPNATVLEVYNQRLFGITGTDQTLYYSALNNGTTLGVAAGGGGSAIVRTFGDQRLTGMAVLGDALLLFHVSGISLFRGYTQDDINISAGAAGVTSDVGTTSPHSIISLENQVLFYSKRGVYSVAQNGQVRNISQKIVGTITEDLTDTQVANVYARHHKGRREVWFFIPSKGIYIYKYDFDAWSGPFTGGYLSPNATLCMWEWEDANGVPGIMVGDDAAWAKVADADGIYKDDIGSDGSTGGATYTAEVTTRRIYFDQPAFEKSFRWGAMFAQLSADALITWLTPVGSGTHTSEGTLSWGYGMWGTGVWGSSEVETFHIPLSGRGAYIQFVITDSTANPFKIVRVEASAFNMNRRAFV